MNKTIECDNRFGDAITIEVESCEDVNGQKHIRVETDEDVFYLTPHEARKLARTLLEMSDEAQDA